MSAIRCGYEGRLTHAQAEALAGKLVYSLEGITGCRIDTEISEIVVELAPEADGRDTENTMEAMLREEAGIRSFGSRIVRDNRLPPIEMTFAGESHDYAVERLYPQDGSLKRDAAAELVDRLDRLFLGLALRRGAGRRKYPSLIARDTLDKCGYIRSFPQNLFVVSEFPHKYETLRSLRAVPDATAALRASPFALSPAVCFHCYAELSGQTVGEPTLLTASGSCFRHEAPWRVGGHRLNEFAMREVVFVGDPAFVEAERSWWMERIWTLFRELGLSGSVATANDPFYYAEDAHRVQLQKMAAMKYELIVRTRRGNEFSIASFNNMGDALCKPFAIAGGAGAFADSGCVAFGIDRWVFALLTEFGPYDKWPVAVRDRLAEEESAASVSAIPQTVARD